MKKNVRAFTLIELLVAMVVSSAVIASSYFIYSTFSKNLVDYKKHINKLGDAVALNGIISHDMSIAKTVKINTANDIVLEQGTKSIHYEWQEDVVLRITDLSTDSFHITVKNIENNFMDRSQTRSDGMIDELKFTSIVEGQEFIFSFEKQYGSDILVEAEKISDGKY